MILHLISLTVPKRLKLTYTQEATISFQLSLQLKQPPCPVGTILARRQNPADIF